MLELKNISFSVTNEEGIHDILKDISVSFADGHFTAVTGPNGSGKSTLVKIIAGILKPTSGRVLWDGEDITDLSISERANKGISFAFQQPVRFQGLSVLDLLRISAGDENLSVSSACLFLSEVGLCARDYVNREVDASLSGGELKRIEIATVLARKTRLTLFDEPEAGIDLWSFQNLIQVFQKLRANTKGTILIISHQERILNTADEILVLENGHIKNFGKSETILPELLASGTASVACTKRE